MHAVTHARIRRTECAAEPFRGRAGFTLMELMLVLAVLIVLTLAAYPRLKDSVERANVKAARVATANYVVKARATALARGCRAVFHMTQGATGRVWITACRLTNVGQVGTAVDTVGAVDPVATRLNVSLGGTADSIQFDARGVNMTYATATFRITGNVRALTDSFRVNQVGKVVVR